MKLFALLAPLAFIHQPAFGQSYPDANAVVSIGGPVTEIVHALGQSDRLIARDTTSRFPETVETLPDVGYMRRLSAEGVLSVGPDLILARATSGPPEAIDQLRAAAIPLVLVPDGFSEAEILSAIETVGTALGVDPAPLASKVEAEFDALPQNIPQDAPRVMFILSNQGGRLNVAGADTGADGIIALAGAENVMAGAYEGYKIMSDEAIIAAAPEAILMMTGEDEHDARKAEILALPAIAQTPAGVSGAFYTVDPAALSFGPRTPEFARALHDILTTKPGN